MPRLPLATCAALLFCPAGAAAGGGPAVAMSSSLGPVWDDPQRCVETVAAGRRLERPPGMVRVGTWNVRWFPDGKPGIAPEAAGTDVAWMACVIAYLDVDVLGLQEIKLTERGRGALGELTAALRRLTGAAWEWHADDCPTPANQHVALLARADRVGLEGLASHGELDPTGHAGAQAAPGPQACSGRLRPGLAAYVRSRAGGVDFHFLTLHLDSGRKARDFANRKAAWTLLDAVLARRAALPGAADPDVVIAGDFNAMGCGECEAKDSPAERALAAAVVAGLPRPLVVVPEAPECSEYYQGHGGLIDLVLRSGAMTEVAGPARVSGPCAASSCGTLSADLPYFQRLSDHCPVVLDVRDRDEDAPQ